jgi:hypothetical protein
VLLNVDDVGIDTQLFDSIDGEDLLAEGFVNSIHDQDADVDVVPTPFGEFLQDAICELTEEEEVVLMEEEVELALIEEAATIGKFKEPTWQYQEEEGEEEEELRDVVEHEGASEEKVIEAPGSLLPPPRQSTRLAAKKK